MTAPLPRGTAPEDAIWRGLKVLSEDSLETPLETIEENEDDGHIWTTFREILAALAALVVARDEAQRNLEATQGAVARCTKAYNEAVVARDTAERRLAEVLGGDGKPSPVAEADPLRHAEIMAEYSRRIDRSGVVDLAWKLAKAERAREGADAAAEAYMVERDWAEASRDEAVAALRPFVAYHDWRDAKGMKTKPPALGPKEIAAAREALAHVTGQETKA